MKKPSLTPNELDKIAFPVVQRFMRGDSVPAIQKAIEKEFGVKVSREGVYPIVRAAVARGLLLQTAPRDLALAERLEAFPNQGHVEVVRVGGTVASEYVATAGAERAYRLIKEIAARRRGKPVHLGLGVGSTTRAFSKRLAQILRSDADAPRLVVHALAPAYSFWDPMETPLAFFTYFHEALPGVEFVGLFAEPIVPAREYASLLEHKVVRCAFERRDEIDIVVTSLASSRDEHGYLYQFLAQFDGSDSIQRLRGAGWLGDLHLRPYSKSGEIPMREGMKPVTLLDIPDLARLADHPDKHVMILVGPCGRCGVSKASAVLPLLLEARLRLWNHLVLDTDTAEALLKNRASLAEEPAAPAKVVSPSASPFGPTRSRSAQPSRGTRVADKP